MLAAAVKISLKFQFFTFFHFWQCHLKAKNSRNLRTKGDMTKKIGIWSGLVIPKQLPKFEKIHHHDVSWFPKFVWFSQKMVLKYKL